MRQHLKKALHRAFFIACVTGLSHALPGSASTSHCAAQHIDREARIAYVYDGDTVRLSGGDKVRLLGINAPEVAHHNHKPPTPAEPYASAARKYLRTRLPRGHKVELQFDEQKKDRYGRLLAHLFLPNGDNLQAELLRHGLARQLTLPPNTALADCYRQSERQARCQSRGLWHNHAATLRPDELGQLVPGRNNYGFRVIEGELRAVERNRHGIWLKLDHDLTIGIRPPEREWFDEDDIIAMQGQRIEVRGWLNHGKRGWYMRIRHPLALQAAHRPAADCR